MTQVFEPAALGPVHLRNRIIKAAAFEGRTLDTLVTDDLVDFPVRHAAGGVGMTTVAHCAVSPEGRTDRHQRWMRPEAVPGPRRLTEAVHARGAAVSAQLGHAGPLANAASNRAPALAPGRLPSPLSLRVMRTASGADLARVTRARAEAPSTPSKPGSTASKSTSATWSRVPQPPAQPPQRRLRRQPAQPGHGSRWTSPGAFRAAAGDQIAVTAKLNMDDGVPGGLWLEESLRVARWLEADDCLDALELTAGSSLLDPTYLFTGDVPLREFADRFPAPQRWGIRLAGRSFLRSYPFEEAFLLDRARQFRAAPRLPLILLGRIPRRETMDRALAEGFAFVALARALLREPGTRPLCIHCNRCMPTIYERTRCVLTPSDG